MTEPQTFEIEAGVRPDHRAPAASGYWEAFRHKLRLPLGPEARAIRFIGAVLDPSHAISAVARTGELLGIAGFKTSAGAFVGGGMKELAETYGWPGALWRGPMLMVLERRVEPDTLLMDGIFVQPAARSMGVGKALLGAIQAHAQRLVLRQVRLDVIDTNPRARALYEREGFRPVAERSVGVLRHAFGFSSATTMVKEV